MPVFRHCEFRPRRILSLFGMKTEPARTIAELKELRELTGDENGAQRVAFTETWATARKWLREKLEAFCPDVQIDEAGNLWATLRGESRKALLIGGHIDSVPNGGWLDGCLNTLAGVEILRRLRGQYKRQPPGTGRLRGLGGEKRGRFRQKLFRFSPFFRKNDNG